ncbi:MAG: amidohydrolase family protein [Verrucomicrobiales bacterium]|nr:amidohydrolase family protein [Verrucomicrobiales bacterium]
MKRSFCLGTLRVSFVLLATMARGDVAIYGEVVHTVAGDPISRGVVLVKGTKIAAVGRQEDVAIPAGTPELRARVVTPGWVDAHSTVGLSGFLNQNHDQEQLERSAPMQPELRAIDAYNPRDELVDYVRSLGVTTLHTGHAPGALISGQTMVVKTFPPSLDQSVLNPSAMLAASLGDAALSDKPDKPPGTRAKAVALLRAELIKATEYARKMGLPEADKRPARDLRFEMLGKLLDRSMPLLVTVHRHQDILAALRLAAEFNLRLVLDGASDAPLVMEEIRASGFPVIVHPTMVRPFQAAENASLETAAKLRDGGVPIALQSGYESYVPRTRVVLFEAAMAAANGLGFRSALAAITLDAARILGVADRVGSLEPGKDADVALFDGDPFEYVTHCTGVVVSGTVMEAAPR